MSLPCLTILRAGILILNCCHYGLICASRCITLVLIIAYCLMFNDGTYSRIFYMRRVVATLFRLGIRCCDVRWLPQIIVFVLVLASTMPNQQAWRALYVVQE